MGKRSTGKFERKARDFYITPPEAVPPLLTHLDLFDARKTPGPALSFERG